MNKIKSIALATAAFLLGGCASPQSSIPLSHQLEIEDTYTIIWNGSSKAFKYEDEKWVRAENYDYQFDVIQKRYDNHWKSVKSMHRLHPDYDGKGGARDQTMYFDVKYPSFKDGKVQVLVTSSLGNGVGATDMEFRNSELTIHTEKSSAFMPYNKFKITQNYDYEKGILTETVLLVKEKDGKEVPFMKNEEVAYFYIKGQLEAAPTIYK